MKFTIVSGNPVEGFSLHGIFDTASEASEAAANDRTMPADWWVISINPL